MAICCCGLPTPCVTSGLRGGGVCDAIRQGHRAVRGRGRPGRV
jgi:hypothetical protein